MGFHLDTNLAFVKGLSSSGYHLLIIDLDGTLIGKDEAIVQVFKEAGVNVVDHENVIEAIWGRFRRLGQPQRKSTIRTQPNVEAMKCPLE